MFSTASIFSYNLTLETSPVSETENHNNFQVVSHMYLIEHGYSSVL